MALGGLSNRLESCESALDSHCGVCHDPGNAKTGAWRIDPTLTTQGDGHGPSTEERLSKLPFNSGNFPPGPTLSQVGGESWGCELELEGEGKQVT